MVKRTILFLVLFTLLTAANAMEEGLIDFKTLQWSHRILLVFPGETADGELAEELQASHAAIDERDIAWFVVSANGVRTNYPGTLADTFGDNVRKRYASAGEPLEIVLIGKDGGVKDRYGELNLEAVFTRIDGMPMRRAEMRRE